MLALLPARAGTLLPGAGPVAPDVFGYSAIGQPLDAFGTQLALKPALTFHSIGLTLAGSLLAEVIADPSNVYCAGCLDFIFQVENAPGSATNITRISIGGFTGFQTDAGYDATTFGGRSECGPADSGACNIVFFGPDSVDRSANGDQVAFNFLSNPLIPGKAAPNLIIETNAIAYTDPSFSVYGSDGSQVLDVSGILGPAGAPVGSVPEPSAALLLGPALLGLLGARRFAGTRRSATF